MAESKANHVKGRVQRTDHSLKDLVWNNLDI